MFAKQLFSSSKFIAQSHMLDITTAHILFSPVEENDWQLFNKPISAKVFYDDDSLDLMLLIRFGEPRTGMLSLPLFINMANIKGQYPQVSGNTPQYAFTLYIADKNKPDKTIERQFILPANLSACLYTSSLNQLTAVNSGKLIRPVFHRYDASILDNIGVWHPCEGVITNGISIQ